ncbi:hypothetical protein ACH4F6_37840 [Streptomyces sp. NPDC017936]|uniref:hypothetical protein n=1 Tax=Streptomyces sp. NPDC017936 TaxID=3365016 RepID=UPI0037BDCC81
MREAAVETVVARAYVYSGEWVADCPAPHCANVEHVCRPSRARGPRDIPVDVYVCSHCGTQAPVAWPDDRFGILAVLSRRPVPGTRNWYPADHPVALRFGIPHGQSVRELEDENEEHGVR